MKTKINVYVDVDVDVEPEGLTRSLYIGESACEPEFTALETWEELVERNLGYYIVPRSNKIRSHDAEQLNQIIVGMEGAIALFKKRLEEMTETE